LNRWEVSGFFTLILAIACVTLGVLLYLRFGQLPPNIIIVPVAGAVILAVITSVKEGEEREENERHSRNGG